MLTLPLKPDITARVLCALVLRRLGGRGSGNFGHSGRKGEVGGSAEPSAAEHEARVKDILRQVQGKYQKYSRNIDLHQEAMEASKTNFNFQYNGPLRQSLSDYVQGDAKPIGKVARDLERAIEQGSKMPEDIISYRGVSLDKESFKSMKEGAVFELGHPSSFTDDEGRAWDFVKPRGTAGRGHEGGYRHKEGHVPVVMRALVPKGTSAAYLNLSSGVGKEHVLSGKESYTVRSVSKWRDGYRVDVELRKR